MYFNKYDNSDLPILVNKTKTKNNKVHLALKGGLFLIP